MWIIAKCECLSTMSHVSWCWLCIIMTWTVSFLPEWLPFPKRQTILLRKSHTFTVELLLANVPQCMCNLKFCSQANCESKHCVQSYTFLRMKYSSCQLLFIIMLWKQSYASCKLTDKAFKGRTFIKLTVTVTCRVTLRTWRTLWSGNNLFNGLEASWKLLSGCKVFCRHTNVCQRSDLSKCLTFHVCADIFLFLWLA